MAIFSSYKLPLLAATALVAPTIAMAQETGTRIIVTGAMQETGTHVTVVGAMQETGTHVTVVGAAQETGTHVTVIGATSDGAQAGEDPADQAIPALPVVYEDDGAAPASATATADKAPAAPTPAGR
ncbi:MAG: hypothetical protein QOD42_536 [Sphingomonadales bacterium]|jgi:hypothetical protein|nr:hypothetical protein [Sphingomonadales bacterium]